MAIYHFSAQVISRGKGQSAVAAAAYRSGDKLQDERTGEEKFYRREVNPDSMILAPSDSPEWVNDRERLWNAVEKAENRKDSQLAREINIALPVELSNGQQKELIRDFVQKEFVEKGMIADVCIHRDDSNNPHAHVMLTTREITAEGFGPKNRSWNDKSLLEQWRAEWANHANKSLEREGVQERISHLSHEARGLEQLPTVHLGQVASEMEKRGVETPQGDINRDRQEYNRLVVDLQKYREEKQAIQQEQARKQEQKQKVERFNTPAERADLQQARKILKADPSLQKISERRQQIEKWADRLNNGDQFLRWKDEKVNEAAVHYKSISNHQGTIQQQQERLENINWLNPLKIKDNRAIKQDAEKTISRALDHIQSHDDKLNYHREKLGFQTETEFRQVQVQHETERPGLFEANKNQRDQIVREVDALRNAEKALKNAFVRQVASNYPNRPETQRMSFETAHKLNEVNRKHGKAVPIELIEKSVTNKNQEIQRLKGEISSTNQYSSRLQRAEGYLKDYEKYLGITEKYENNPILKAKKMISKTAKYEYDRAVISRDSCQKNMKNEGVSGRADFEKQKNISGEMEARIPEFKGQIQFAQKGMDIFDAVVKGIEQAGREAEMSRKIQEQHRTRGKGKKRQNGWDMER